MIIIKQTLKTKKIQRSISLELNKNFINELQNVLSTGKINTENEYILKSLKTCLIHL